MDHDPQPIISLVNKEHKTSIDLDRYSVLSLYDKPITNRFERFLIESRIRPFLLLKILHHIGFDKTFTIGHHETNFYSGKNIDADEYADEEVITVKDSIIAHLFTGKQVFDYLLKKLSFEQILVSGEALVEGQKRLTLSGPFSVDFIPFNETHKGELLIMVCPDQRVILSEDKVYVDDPDLEEYLIGLLSLHAQIFDVFLERYKESVVPHELYVGWLTSWFHGDVIVKGLPES